MKQNNTRKIQKGYGSKRNYNIEYERLAKEDNRLIKESNDFLRNSEKRNQNWNSNSNSNYTLLKNLDRLSNNNNNLRTSKVNYRHKKKNFSKTPRKVNKGGKLK